MKTNTPIWLGSELMAKNTSEVSPMLNAMSHAEQAQFWAGFMGAMFGACSASVGISDTELLISMNLDACRVVAWEKTQ